MLNIDSLSPAELQNLIKEAQSKLEQKQNSMRKEVISQIKELAASIGVTVDIIDDKKTKKKPINSSGKIRQPQQPCANLDRARLGAQVA